MMQKLTPQKYIIKETHDFTMCLPETYWGPGSYNNWIKVGWALKNTHKKLLLSWIKFSSQSPDFSYSDISDICDRCINTFDSKQISKFRVILTQRENLINDTDSEFILFVYPLFFFCIRLRSVAN